MRTHTLAGISLALLLGAGASAAKAVDGCLVLLCLAGNWSAIPQCVPPVEELFLDLALGGSFPSCAFASVPSFSLAAPSVAPAQAATAGAGVAGASSASNEWITEQTCPPQLEIRWGTFFSCSGYMGLIKVVVNGEPWSQTLWSAAGKSLTCYWPAAEAALGPSGTGCDQLLAPVNAGPSIVGLGGR